MCISLIYTGLCFWGICAFAKKKLRIDSKIVPLFGACTIICVLMLGGMLGVLLWAKRILQVLGIAGYVYYVCIRRNKPDWPVIGVICAFLLICALRFHGQLYTGNDSVSHWGLVAQYLFRYDAFPDSGVEYVFFQSYPLGTACFIYFFAAGTSLSEGFCLAAQYMLKVLAFIPMLSFVKKNRWLGWLLSLVSFLLISTAEVKLASLQVDILLPILALGATTGMLYHARSPKKAALIALPMMTVLVWIKSSGAFFSVILALLLTVLVSRNSTKKKAILIFAASMLVIVIAFFSWNLYVKCAYESGLATKHAVSLTQYANNLQQKDARQIRQIATQMLKRMLLKLTETRILMFGGSAILLAAPCIIVSRKREERTKYLRLLKTTVAVEIVLLALWYIMLFFMYLFSMPTNEAIALASFGRYEATMLVYVYGIALIYALHCLSDMLLSKKCIRAIIAAASLGLICVCFAWIGGINLNVFDLFAQSSIPKIRTDMVALNEKYDIEDGKSYLIYADNAETDYFFAYYLTKYQYMSNDIILISNHIDANHFDPEQYCVFTNVRSNACDYAATEDIAESLMQYADECDYILVLHEDEGFASACDRFIEEYTGDIPIMYAYDR